MRLKIHGTNKSAGIITNNMGIEPWDVVDTWPLEQQIGYYRGSALKYIMRMGSKDERLQEAEKGLHYQEKLVDALRKEQHAHDHREGNGGE
jgi:hypothetical protein